MFMSSALVMLCTVHEQRWVMRAYGTDLPPIMVVVALIILH
jgi:hypothetical protein